MLDVNDNPNSGPAKNAHIMRYIIASCSSFPPTPIIVGIENNNIKEKELAQPISRPSKNVPNLAITTTFYILCRNYITGIVKNQFYFKNSVFRRKKNKKTVIFGLKGISFRAEMKEKKGETKNL